jgi:hypothetical protein
VLREAQEEIVSGSARCTTATFAAGLDHAAHQRQLGLMEGQPLRRHQRRPSALKVLSL